MERDRLLWETYEIQYQHYQKYILTDTILAQLATLQLNLRATAQEGIYACLCKSCSKSYSCEVLGLRGQFTTDISLD